MTIDKVVKRLIELFPEELSNIDLNASFEYLIDTNEIEISNIDTYSITLYTDTIRYGNGLYDYESMTGRYEDCDDYDDIRDIVVKHIKIYGRNINIINYSTDISEIFKDLDQIKSLHFNDFNCCKNFILNHTDLPRRVYFYNNLFTFIKPDGRAIEITDITKTTMITDIRFETK